MSITAATSSTNRIVRQGPGKSLFENAQPLAGSNSWFQGDLMCWDTTNNYMRVVAATGDAATFIGIADNQVTSGKLAGPYDGLTQNNSASVGPMFAGPKYGVVANMKVNTGDDLVAGCKVYLLNGGDTQTVTVSNPGDGNYVGIYVGSTVASAVSGTTYPILLGARYPAATGAGLVF